MVQEDLTSTKSQNSVKENSSKDESPEADCDFFLRHLVFLTNKFHLYFPITLSLSGVLISGEMIDGKTYFEELGRMMKEGFSTIGDEEFATAMQNSFASFGQTYEELQHKESLADSELDEEKMDEESAEQERATYFVHLRDARAYYPTGAIPTKSGSIWRVRLSQVDGYLFGRLGIG